MDLVTRVKDNWKSLVLVIGVIAIIVIYCKNKKESTRRNPTLNKKHQVYQNVQTIYLFYSPNCGFCTKFMPTWKNLVGYYGNSNLQLVAINCLEEDNAEIVSLYNINRYPTIIIQTNNSNVEYSGDRSIEDIINFVEQMEQ